MTLGQLLFSTHGRVSRSTFWVYVLLFAGLAFVASVVEQVSGAYDREYGIGCLTALLYVLAAVPLWSVYAKRCHDRGYPNWYLFFALVPVLGPLWLLIDLGLIRGTPGTNKYGPDPIAHHWSHKRR